MVDSVIARWFFSAALKNLALFPTREKNCYDLVMPLFKVPLRVNTLCAFFSWFYGEILRFLVWLMKLKIVLIGCHQGSIIPDTIKGMETPILLPLSVRCQHPPPPFFVLKYNLNTIKYSCFQTTAQWILLSHKRPVLPGLQLMLYALFSFFFNLGSLAAPADLKLVMYPKMGLQVCPHHAWLYNAWELQPRASCIQG